MRRARVLALLLLALAVAAPTAHSAATAERTAHVETVVGHPCPVAVSWSPDSVERDFNPYDPLAVDFTLGGIYEPLVISTPMGGGHQYRWLAQKLTWSKDGKTLTIGVRRGVRWSDGQPLTAADVVYSLRAGYRNVAFDRIGLLAKDNLVDQITQTAPYQVEIHFKAVDGTFVNSRLIRQFVVPEHVFERVEDLTKWKNQKPVGSGPFARVLSFDGRSYRLGRNRHYWQKGAPAVPCIEAHIVNDSAAKLQELVRGSADWSNEFIQNVTKNYVAADPLHYRAFYSTNALPIGLFFDDQIYPYSIVGFRKAVSVAINRKAVSSLGGLAYGPPTDALGIANMWPTWTDPKLKTQAKKLATYSPATARKMLVAAGFSYGGTKLFDPQGLPVKVELHVMEGWGDWVYATGVIQRNLQDVGIEASVVKEPDLQSWQQGALSTKWPTMLWNTGDAPTPFDYFKAHFHTDSNLGSGVDSSVTGNWEHFSDPAATKLLELWRSTLNPITQHAIAYKLQAAFLDKLPYIPLYINPRYATTSSRYFVGWPSARNPYANPDFRAFPDVSKILVSLRPRPR